MQQELLQFNHLGVLHRVIPPKGCKSYGLKRVLKNKKDDQGIMIRYKSRLVVNGYQHIPDIDYDEVYAPVAILEEIRMFLEFASFRGFKGVIDQTLFIKEKDDDIILVQANPNVIHMLATKKIMRYLKGTPSLGLWYAGNDGFEITAHSDYDYEGCKRNFKSTSGGCSFLGSR
ncbi:uncharacterized protein [Rutidosis leptorrhynchoides]|uniref:uncharacterized protein n=1 Tax=Rutidosis leptorrhynchoides TaxID=125765 RepID=UPI003A99FEF5